MLIKTVYVCSLYVIAHEIFISIHPELSGLGREGYSKLLYPYSTAITQHYVYEYCTYAEKFKVRKKINSK